MLYLITYDLKNPDQNYDTVYELIKSFGNYLHCLDSAWLVDTILTDEEMANRLIPHIATDKNDRLLITELSKRHFDAWLPDEYIEWIDKYSN